MTLPQPVADAITGMSSRCQSRGLTDTYPACVDDWQTIRSHLLSQDAEIDRLNAWAVDYHKLMRAEHLNAESRLASADALLRECNAIAHRRGDPYGLCDAIDNHGQAYQSAHLASHLRGDGDEA